MESQPTLEARIAELEAALAAEAARERDLLRDLGHYRALVERTGQPAYLKDATGRYLLVNPEFERLSGVSLERLRGRVDEDVFPPAVAQLFREQDRAVIAAGKNLLFEETVPLVDGVHSYITEKFPLFDEGGAVRAVGGICTDITRHKELVAALDVEKARLAATLRHLTEAVIATDAEGRVLLLNPAAARLTGWVEDEARGRPLAEVFVESPDVEPLVLRGAARDPLERSVALTARDGVTRPVAVSVAPLPDTASGGVGQVLVVRDITDERRLLGELLKARKLESLQIVAGGVAHDFNNFLAAILGSLSLAAALTRGEGGQIHDLLVEAEEATLVARQLTQQLLTFARGGHPVKKRASLAEVVRESARFVLRGSESRCELEIADDLWLADIDTGQMSQVVQNLILNASQAMAGGGVIPVRCENVTLASGELGLPPGGYVRLTVSDRGVGIPVERQERIFDPFFTTRPGGTGLGLAITHSIVARHGGHVAVSSTVGEGSTFTVHVPAAAGEAAPPAAAPVARVRAGLGCRVLVMDDNPRLRVTLGELLKYLDCETVTCGDGREAAAIYEEHLRRGRRFDLVIMDLTVPGGMGGKDAVGLVLAVDPGARVVVSSGYSEDLALQRYAELGFCAILPKPYQLEDIEALLDAERARRLGDEDAPGRSGG